MNKAQLEAEKSRLEWERRKIDNELSPILDSLRKLDILAKVIDECDNGAGHYYKELWSERCPSGDTEASLLLRMAKDGLLRVRGYSDEVITVNDIRGNTARFTITPQGRAVLEESEVGAHMTNDSIDIKEMNGEDFIDFAWGRVKKNE